MEQLDFGSDKGSSYRHCGKCQLTCGKFRLLHRIADKAGQQQKRQHEDNQCGITGSGQLISRSPFIRDGDCKKLDIKNLLVCTGGDEKQDR